MKRSTDRILTTHVGSLVRPPALLSLLRARQAGEAVDEALATTLRDAVGEVVRQQVECGIDVVSDGEFGKSSFLTYAHERMSGFTSRPLRPGEVSYLRQGRDRADFAAFYAEADAAQGAGASVSECTGELTYTGAAALARDLANFRAALTGVTAVDGFVAAISPGNFARGENAYYRSDEEFVHATAQALRTEYRAIVDAGFMLQIDAPVGSYDYLDLTKAEFRRRLAVSIEALNAALTGIPADRVRYHVCWGSWNAPHTHDIPLRDIVDLVLGVNAAYLSLEAANPRHAHEVEVWADVRLPADKVLLPGVIGHATNIVEHPELVAWRLKRYAALVGRESVIASSDCGFAQGAFTRRVHPSIMWAKLRSLAEGARIASRELWR